MLLVSVQYIIFTILWCERFHVMISLQGGGTGPAGPVLAGPLFQVDLKHFSANQ